MFNKSYITAIGITIVLSFVSFCVNAKEENIFRGPLGILVSIFLTPDKELTYFSFDKDKNVGVLNNNVSAEILNKRIRMLVPYNTNLEKVVSTFEITGKDMLVEGKPQVSGVSANNFSNHLNYTTIANDSSTSDYTVIVDKGRIDSKRLKTFGFLERNNNLEDDVYGVFLGYNVTVILPYGSSLNPLVAKFTTDGMKVQLYDVDQISELTTNDFSKPLTYKVYAANNTVSNYTVVTAVATIDAKEIRFFMFTQDANPQLPSDFYATITDNHITVTLPHGTDRSSLIASFVSTGRNVSVNNITQRSNITTNDYSKILVYQVTAADESKAEYSVIVKLEELTVANCILDKSAYDDGCILSQ
jgi:hypothetical protein